jgi:hypothetical protein
VVEASEARLNADSANFAPCTSPVVYEGLAPGSHVFRVRAKDQAGNVDSTPAVAKFKVE